MAVTNETPELPVPPTAPELVAVAGDWLKQRGVPYFLDPREYEHRVVHAIVSVAFAAAVGAVLAVGDGVSRGVAAGIAGTLVLAAVVVSAVLRRNEPEREYRVMPPGKINIATAVAIVVAWAVDSVAAGRIRVGETLILAAALACLLAFAAATPLGAVRILWWAAGHPFREARQNVRVLAGALPLLLLTVAFLLLTTELWVAASNLSDPELAATLGLFVALGLAFLVVLAHTRIADGVTFDDWTDVREYLGDRRPVRTEAVDALEALVSDCLRHAATFERWDEVRAWLDQRPRTAQAVVVAEEFGAFDAFLGSLHVPERWLERIFRRQRETRRQLGELRDSDYWDQLPDVHGIAPLSRRERWNITIVLVFGQGVQVLLVSLLMVTFFLLFGRLTVDDATLEAWKVTPQEGWWLWSGQHLKVAALLAAFAGLSYAVYAALFKEQRELFFCELDRKTTQRLAVRALHRGLRAVP